MRHICTAKSPCLNQKWIHRHYKKDQISVLQVQDLDAIDEVMRRINIEGCIPAIQSMMERNLYPVGGAAIGVALSQVTVFSFSRCLCISTFLPVSLYLCLSFFISVGQSFFLCLAVFISVWESLSLSVNLFLCLSVFISFCQSLSRVCLSPSVSTFLSLFFISLSLFLCLLISLPLALSISSVVDLSHIFVYTSNVFS